MGYAPRRSMNANLSEGATDGKYKKVSPDRGGFIDTATYENRTDLNDNWFGIHEKKVKVAPDGLLHATPEYTQTPNVTTVDTV